MMFIVFLNFATDRAKAHQFMDGHRDWLNRGFAEGVFLLAGSVQPNRGGAIIAHNTTLSDLQRRVEDDPFVVHEVVTAEIFDITLSKADPRLQFLSV